MIERRLCFELLNLSVPVIHSELTLGEVKGNYFITTKGKKYSLENTCMDDDYSTQSMIFAKLQKVIKNNQEIKSKI